MSTKRVSRGRGSTSTGEPSSSPSPANSRPGRRGNTRGRGPRGQPQPSERRERNRVWGKTPNAGVDQASMTKLFESQKQLNAALRRQARLAKLPVSEVRSTQAEQLRAVNEAILHASSSALGVKNPFSDRNLIDSQIKSEEMIRRSGAKQIGGAPMAKPSRPTKFLIKKHRKDRMEPISEMSYHPPHEKLLTIRGPLLRSYRRAVERGYKGPPGRWLRGTQALHLWGELLKKGFSLSPPGTVGMFHSRSPLRWAVTAHTGVRSELRRGFHGERIRPGIGNVPILRRQAASVKRLKLKDWPTCHDNGQVGLSWPTFPTLAESQEMLLRGKSPQVHRSIASTKLLSEHKVPTKQVKPGSAARAISKLLIGIRADIEVPRKFLAYFSYRWGFLILHRQAHLPAELVKFLSEIWKKDISGCFLRCLVRYNDALRRLPSSARWAIRGFYLGGVQRSVERSGTSKRTRPPRRIRNQVKQHWLQESRSKTPDQIPSSSDLSDDGVRLY
jgi:hypothetical protein